MGDKITHKPEYKQKVVLDERKRDRGDTLKKQDISKNKLNDITNKGTRKILPNQGDVPTVNRNPKISRQIYYVTKIDKSNDGGKKQNEVKSKLANEVSPKVNSGVVRMSLNKTSDITTAGNKTKIGDRIVSDKAIKGKALTNLSQAKDIKNATKSESKPEAPKETPDSHNQDIGKMDSDVTKKEKDTTPHRRAMIKTIKSKNDNKVYKAVTFTEQRRVKPTVLEINIPSLQMKKPKTKDKILEAKPASVQGTTNKSTSRVNLKGSHLSRRNRLTERTKRKKLNRCISSPDKFKRVESPPTEVAKWAPSCLNTHTKPYYEAWVNTTLAAISKISKKDKLFMEKQNIIKNFQKSLELGTESPELVHEDYNKEYYTGRIKIKQKNVSKNRRQPLIAPLLDLDR